MCYRFSGGMVLMAAANWACAFGSMGLCLGDFSNGISPLFSFLPGGGRGAVELAPLRRRSRGERLGWGGQRGASPRALRALSPSPSPSPIKGEGIEEGESLPEIALVLHRNAVCRQQHRDRTLYCVPPCPRQWGWVSSRRERRVCMACHPGLPRGARRPHGEMHPLHHNPTRS